jgi:hypothetical protein
MTNWIAVLIAFGVLLVGYAQWRTANQRVVLDLFEKRTKAYGRLESAIVNVMREGAVDNETFQEFATARAEARFLFGSDAIGYLKNVYDDVVYMKVHSDELISRSSDSQVMIDKKYAALNRISEFTERAPEIFGPYVAMTQKNTPFWRPW